jgi:hypothetical protein
VAPEDQETGAGGEAAKEAAPTEITTEESARLPSSGLLGGPFSGFGKGGSGFGTFGRGRRGKGVSSSGLGSFGIGKSGFGSKDGSSSPSGLRDILGSMRGDGSGSSGRGFGKLGGGSGGFGGTRSGLGGLFGGGSEDDLSGNFACKKVALLFARGTTEPGTLGMSVGPRLAAALRQQYNGDILVKGISYPGMCFPGFGDIPRLKGHANASFCSIYP